MSTQRVILHPGEVRANNRGELSWPFQMEHMRTGHHVHARNWKTRVEPPNNIFRSGDVLLTGYTGDRYADLAKTAHDIVLSDGAPTRREELRVGIGERYSCVPYGGWLAVAPCPKRWCKPASESAFDDRGHAVRLHGGGPGQHCTGVHHRGSTCQQQGTHSCGVTNGCMKSNHAAHRDPNKMHITLDLPNEMICKSVERVAVVERYWRTSTVDRWGKGILDVKPFPARGVQTYRMKKHECHTLTLGHGDDEIQGCQMKALRTRHLREWGERRRTWTSD